MVWPTLGSRTAKEQNRTEQNFCDNTSHCLLHSATFMFFHGHLITKLTERLLSRNGKIIIIYNDIMLMSNHCSNI